MVRYVSILGGLNVDPTLEAKIEMSMYPRALFNLKTFFTYECVQVFRRGPRSEFLFISLSAERAARSARQAKRKASTYARNDAAEIEQKKEGLVRSKPTRRSAAGHLGQIDWHVASHTYTKGALRWKDEDQRYRYYTRVSARSGGLEIWQVYIWISCSILILY